MFDWVENKHLASGWGFKILSWLLSSGYKLNRENTQPENMRDSIFGKVKDSGGTVNRTSVYTEAAGRRIL